MAVCSLILLLYTPGRKTKIKNRKNKSRSPWLRAHRSCCYTSQKKNKNPKSQCPSVFYPREGKNKTQARDSLETQDMTHYNYITLYYRRSPEGLTQARGILETHHATPPAGTAHLLGSHTSPTQQAAFGSQHPAPGKKINLKSQSPSIDTRHSHE